MGRSPKVLGLEGIVNEIYNAVNRKWSPIHVYTNCQTIVKGLQGDHTCCNVSLPGRRLQSCRVYFPLLIGKKIWVWGRLLFELYLAPLHHILIWFIVWMQVFGKKTILHSWHTLFIIHMAPFCMQILQLEWEDHLRVRVALEGIINAIYYAVIINGVLSTSILTATWL